MALVEMRAKFRCDGCGRLFSVRVDAADSASDDVFGVAENALAGSIDYDGPRGVTGTDGSSSLQDGLHLCGPCTTAADEAADKEETAIDG